MIFLWDDGMRSIRQKNSDNDKILACRFLIRKGFLFLLIAGGMISFLSVMPTGSPQDPMYIPSTPNGPTVGFVGIDYEYTIVTMNPDSLWMFDWGDGTNTSWLRLEENKTSIVQTHHWSHPGDYQLHVKYMGETAPYGIWSDALLVEMRNVSSQDFPGVPKIQTAKILGIAGQTYTYSALCTDPNDQAVSYRFDFDNENLSSWTSFVPSDTSSYVVFSWPQPGTYHVRVQARNKYGLESEWSYPIEVTIKDASEDNGASMDFLLINTMPYHVIYTSPYQGTLYNPGTGYSNDIYWNGGGVFLLDDDGDGRWEYFYIPAAGQIQPYTTPNISEETFFSQLPWVLILIIGSIILGVVGVVLVLIKTGYIYVYEEEVVVDE
jgi:hypothetical protein